MRAKQGARTFPAGQTWIGLSMHLASKMEFMWFSFGFSVEHLLHHDAKMFKFGTKNQWLWQTHFTTRTRTFTCVLFLTQTTRYGNRQRTRYVRFMRILCIVLYISTLRICIENGYALLLLLNLWFPMRQGEIVIVWDLVISNEHIHQPAYSHCRHRRACFCDGREIVCQTYIHTNSFNYILCKCMRACWLISRLCLWDSSVCGYWMC